jgi:hypothetical protein
MDRRIVIVTLFVVLTVLALTLASLASGTAGSPAGAPRPTMSGEFAHNHFAAAVIPAGPSIHVPPDGWGRVRGVRHPHGEGHRPSAWV